MDTKQPLKIVCLKWGDKYQAHYVNKLYAGIARNTTIPFQLHCFTENPRGLFGQIITHSLPFDTIESWWNKLFLFSNDAGFAQGEKIFYGDLDTLMVGNINQILSYNPEKLVILRDFYTGLARTVVGDNNVGSGLMYWKHGQYSYVWESFIKDPRAAIESVKPHGDQKWIQNCISDRLYWQDLFPGQINSFKVHCNTGLPAQSKIICYHGKPSIPESYSKRNRVWKYDIPPQQWVRNHWRES